jgi:hypothetical protein
MMVLVKVVRDGVGIRATYVCSFNIIFYAIFIALFALQYAKNGVLLNVGLLSLLSLLISVDFIKSLELRNIELHRIVVGGLILTFSLLTLQSAAGWKYTYTTGAGGILSAFMLLAGFIMCYSSQSKQGKVLSYILGGMLIVLSIRGPILSALLFVALSRNFRIMTYAKAGLSGVIVFLIVYAVAPESRIFEMHMSGRWIHWLMIWAEFDWNTLLYGMGDASAAGVLLNHGMGGSMAAPHNEILRIFHDFGLGGLALLVLSLIKMMGVIPENKWAFFSAILIPFIFDNAFSYFFSFMFLFLLAALWSGSATCGESNKMEQNRA